MISKSLSSKAVCLAGLIILTASGTFVAGNQQTDSVNTKPQKPSGSVALATNQPKQAVPNEGVFNPRKLLADRRFTICRSIDSEKRWFLEAVLEQPTPKLNFPGETPLNVILDTLQKHFQETYGSDTNHFVFYPDHSELELEHVKSLNEIMVRDIVFPAMPLKNALRLILEQTDDPLLGYNIENDVVLITTEAKAWDTFQRNVYEVGDLIELLTPYRDRELETANGLGRGSYIHPFVKLIAESTPRCDWQWVDGEGGCIRVEDTKLFVDQSVPGQRDVTDVLEILWRLLQNPVFGTASDGAASAVNEHEFVTTLKENRESEVSQNLPSVFEPRAVFADRTFKPCTPIDSERRWFLEAVLEQPGPKLDFPGETPLSKILETIQKHVQEIYGNDENQFFIYPDFAELRCENIHSLNEVMIRDVVLPPIQLRSAFNLVMRQAIEPELTYVIHQDVLLITTLAKAEQMFELKLHEVGHLLQQLGPSFTLEPSSSDPLGRPGLNSGQPILDVIREFTGPIWVFDGGAKVGLIGSKLIIYQTPYGQRAVEELLEMLRLSGASSAQQN